MWDPYAEFESTTLPNGLTVYAAHWPNRPWEAVGFLIYSGAEQDPVGLEGLIHFVEHLVSKNTPISYKDINNFFLNHGGAVSLGSTGYGSTYYQFFVPADKTVLCKAFSLFGQMLFQGQLKQFVEREREVIIEEFHRHFPFKFNFDLEIRENKALYKGLWLERFATPLGTPESVNRITKKDLQRHYDQHYTPANMSIVGVGGMNLDQLVALLLESPFSIDKPGSRTPFPKLLGTIAPPLENRYVFEYSTVASMSEPVKVGSYRSTTVIPVKAEPGIWILNKMLNEILDDEIRQSRTWTYDIEVSWNNAREFYELQIKCGSFKLEALNNIEDVIESCIVSIANREDLFLKVKRHTIMDNRMCDATGKGIEKGALKDLERFGRIISLAEMEQEAQAVQFDDVLSLLKWLRPERRWTLIRKP